MDDKQTKQRVLNLAEQYGVEKKHPEAHTAFLNRLVLRLAEEITRYQELNTQLYKRINEAVEQSPQYQQILSECQRLQLTSDMWRESCEKAEKELEELKAQEPETAAAAIEAEPTRKPTTEPEQEQQPETEPPKLRVKPLKQGRPMALSDPDEIERVRELRRQGVSIRTITADLQAAGYSISRESVRRLVNGITPKKGSDND